MFSFFTEEKELRRREMFSFFTEEKERRRRRL
jgi:hypothetical protein